MTRVPRALLIPIAALALLAILAALLVLLFPAEKAARALTREIETATGWKASVRRVGLGLLPPSIRVEDLVLSGHPAYRDTSEIRVPSARVRARLWPLLRGNLQVTRAAVERPVVRLAVAEAPRGVAARGGAAPGAPPAAVPASLALSLARLDIEGGRVSFQDTTGFAIALDSLDATLSAEAAKGFETVIVLGRLASPRVDVTIPLVPSAAPVVAPGNPTAPATPAMPASVTVRDLRCEADARLVIRPRESTLTIEGGRFRVNDLSATATGTVRGLGAIPEVDLAIEAPDASVGSLLSLVPDAILARKGDLDASGRATIRARVTGPTAPPGNLRVEGSVAVSDGRIAYRGLPGAIEGIRASARLAPERLDIDSLAALFEGEPVRLSGSIAPLAPPVIDLTIDGALSLDQIGRWPVLRAVESLAGRARVSLRAAGPAAPPQALHLDGTIDLERVAVTPRGWTAGVEGLAGRVRLAGTSAAIEGLSGRIGRSDFRVDGTVADALSPRPSARLTIASRLLDLDALAAAAGAPLPAPAGGAVVAAPLALPILPDVRLAAEIRADTLVAQKVPVHAARADVALEDRALRATLSAGALRVPGAPLAGARATLTVKERRLDGEIAAERADVGRVPLTNIAAKVAVTPEGAVEITGGRASAFTGTLAGDVRVLLAGGQPRYTFKVRGEGLEMNDFLSHLTPVKDAFFGRLDLSGDFEGEGLTAEEAKASLRAGGNALAANGRVVPNPVLVGIADLLGLPELREISFRTMKSGFRVEGGRVSVDDLALDAPDARWNLAGSMGFDGSLDYRLGVLLSKPLADRAIRKVGEVARAFTDEKGELLVPLVISGTVRAPRVTIDVSKAISRARGDALRDAARSLGVDEKVLQDPGGALKDPGAVRGLLDRLGGKKERKPAAPETAAAGDTSRGAPPE